MRKLPLHIRALKLPTDRWVTLDEACKIADTSSKDYFKMLLFAHESIQWRKVLVTGKISQHMPNTWRFEFRRIEVVSS